MTPPRGVWPFMWHHIKGAKGWMALIMLTGLAFSGIEALIEGLEGRLWMTVYGVIAVILTQAIQSILQFAEKGG